MIFLQLIFLGTGTSHGVPVAGCSCSVCNSENIKNNRYRTSLFLKNNQTSLLIDTSPELRLQLLKNNINHLDAILFTHPHADHIMGFDDIRALNRAMKQSVPCYGNYETIQHIKNTFPYIFNAIQKGGGLPKVSFYEIDSSFYINSTKIIPLPIKHGKMNILGYRIGSVAYLTDCSNIPNSTYQLLDGVEILIIDALRYKRHPTHMNLSEAMEVINKLDIPRAYLTHLSHKLEYERLLKELPDHVKPAYDGLKIKLYD